MALFVYNCRQQCQAICLVERIAALLFIAIIDLANKDQFITTGCCYGVLWESQLSAENLWSMLRGRSETTFYYGLFARTFKFATQKQERKGGWEPSFASNLRVNFRVLIRPYWPGQVHSNNKDTLFDPLYKNWNVRGRKGLKNWQSLILFTVRKMC